MSFTSLPFSMRPLFIVLLLGSLLHAQQPAAPKPKPPAYLSAEEAGEDFIIQGEYSGMLDGQKIAAQVWAKGKGEFEAIGFMDGLPGAGWNEDRRNMQRVQGTREPGKKQVIFRHENSTATADGGTLQVEENGVKATLKKETKQR